MKFPFARQGHFSWGSCLHIISSTQSWKVFCHHKIHKSFRLTHTKRWSTFGFAMVYIYIFQWFLCVRMFPCNWKFQVTFGVFFLGWPLFVDSGNRESLSTFTCELFERKQRKPCWGGEDGEFLHEKIHGILGHSKKHIKKTTSQKVLESSSVWVFDLLLKHGSKCISKHCINVHEFSWNASNASFSCRY